MGPKEGYMLCMLKVEKLSWIDNRVIFRILKN